MPADELTPTRRIRLLRGGQVDVLGRIPWGSNITLLADLRVDPPAEAADDGTDGETSDPEPMMRVVYKPRQGERPLWDFTDGLDRREVAAYEISEALGWGIVPETVLREDLPYGVGSLQRFVPFAEEEHYFTLLEDPSHHAALQTICCFDLLTNQADRKAGHCLLGEDKRIWAVDNGLSFHRDLKLRTVIWDFAGEPVPDDLRADVTRLVDEGLPPSLTELIDEEEQTALLRRARFVADLHTFPHDPTGRRYPWPPI